MAAWIAQARAEARARQGDRPALTDESIKEAVKEFRFKSSKAEQEEARGAAEAKWGRVADWDVSGVTSMAWLFYEAREFSEDLGLWDVSACEYMQYMFSGATAFDAANHAPWYKP